MTSPIGCALCSYGCRGPRCRLRTTGSGAPERVRRERCGQTSTQHAVPPAVTDFSPHGATAAQTLPYVEHGEDEQSRSRSVWTGGLRKGVSAPDTYCERPERNIYCRRVPASFGGALMVNILKELGRRRYVGDSRTNVVHDRWHEDCEGCGLAAVVRSGHAVGFTPDTLDGALWAGYEYCEACHDRTEPSAPRWASVRTAPDEPDTRYETGVHEAGRRGLGREFEAPRQEMLASQEKR